MAGPPPVHHGPLGHRLTPMKELVTSVPTGTFPADIGDKVRISLTKVNGLDVIDAFVVDLVTGCGTADRVTLRYDETMLPFGVNQLHQCLITGFQKQCACCATKPCYEVFSPTQMVVEGNKFLIILPGDFRLDQVKFYSPGPEQVPLKVQLSIGGTYLFPHNLLMEEQVVTINRAAFASAFATGYIAAGTVIEVDVVDAPQGMYYEAPWHGLTVCLSGVWYPYFPTVRGALRRTPGVRPVVEVPDPGYPTYPGEYPAGAIAVGDGTYVTDGAGNFVVEGNSSQSTVIDGSGNTVVDGGGSTVVDS